MIILHKVQSGIRAAQELGLRPLALYTGYRLGLLSGYLRHKTTAPAQAASHSGYSFRPLVDLPDRAELAGILGEQGIENLLGQADEVKAGQVRLFGSRPVSLQLTFTGADRHWTDFEKSPSTTLQCEDIKFIWEPARFGWAYTLGRAYFITGDESYPQAFWEFTTAFLESNKPYNGPQWISAQEVALRLMVFVFSLQIFAPSAHTSHSRKDLLVQAIADHAARIPATLAYARSLGNNHLLSEAVGLYTASLALPGHPSAPRWRSTGWRWLNHSLHHQIAEDGTYIQHSTNYHRLMLQLALWARAISKHDPWLQTNTGAGPSLPRVSSVRLRAATRWLLALVDPHNGRVPNLGPNDGAYIFPWTVCPFSDYRPVLQAAAIAFHGERPFQAGPWDEMAAWFLEKVNGKAWERQQSRHPISFKDSSQDSHAPHVLVTKDLQSWAYLRAARFTARPSHADQLHVDLWWKGLNVAQDAGAYLYNASQPWDNSLARTSVHNTIAIDQRDQMTYAGRFLWLDWAQAQVISHQNAEDGAWGRLVARHDGYRALGLFHQRMVEFRGIDWLIRDDVFPSKTIIASPSRTASTRLHWLLPDWPWELDEDQSTIGLRILSPFGDIWIHVSAPAGEGNNQARAIPGRELATQLVKAGELLHGAGPISPTWGWYSPTYGEKIPALSFSVTCRGLLPLTLQTRWQFPR